MGGRALKAETQTPNPPATQRWPRHLRRSCRPAKTPVRLLPRKQCPRQAWTNARPVGSGQHPIETSVGEGFRPQRRRGTGINSTSPTFAVSRIETMGARIRQTGIPRPRRVRSRSVHGRRDGTISTTPEQSGGGLALADLKAQQALLTTRQLPALPEAFPNPELVVHLTFQYTR